MSEGFSKSDSYQSCNDRISDLPDDFIIEILCLLSLIEAATTSVLSSRWRHLWKYTSHLNFGKTSCSNDIKPQDKRLKYVNRVNSVLESHRAPSIKHFSVFFPLRKSNQQHVSKWFRFALSRRAERVSLDFYKVHRKHSENAIVLEDILRGSNVECCGFIFLKSLRLKGLVVSGEDVKLVLGNCPSLEELKICWSIISSDLEISSCSLRHLWIHNKHKRYSTKVDAPNLTYMFSGHRPKLLIFENVSKLVDACFFVGEKDRMQSFANVGSLLESLTLHVKVSKMFWGFAETPKLNKLTLICKAGENIFLPLTHILQATPRLVVLKIKAHPSNTGVFIVPRAKSPHGHLKDFQFIGFRVDADDHIKLLRYIVENCVVLERVSITSHAPKFSGDDSDDAPRQTTKEYTRQQLAAKFDVPHHIKLSIV